MARADQMNTRCACGHGKRAHRDRGCGVGNCKCETFEEKPPWISDVYGAWRESP
jgi:hypothetical protein